MIRPARTTTVSVSGSRSLYVSGSGNDSNVGTQASPLKTGQEALDQLGGSGEIVYMQGDYVDEKIDLTAANQLRVRSIGGEIVRILLGEKVNVFTNHSGNIWKATISTVIPDDISGNRLQRIFEWGTPYGTITNPLPQHRGRTTRLDHTPLTRVASIGAVSAGKFFFDSATNIIYLERTNSANPNAHDYWIPSQTEGQSFLKNGTEKTNISVEGIEAYFGLNNADLVGCHRFITSKCTWFGSGLFGLLSGTSPSGGTIANIVGRHEFDEFLANADDGGVMSVDNGSTRGQIDLINIRTSDNGDEGWNPHNFTDMRIEGGLFEYNASGGITIPQGASAIINNAYTRGNTIGINCVVNPANNAIINNWISESDAVGFEMDSLGTAILNNCTMISPTIAPFIKNVAGGIIKAYNQTFLNLVDGAPSRIMQGDQTNCYIYTSDPVYIQKSFSEAGPRSSDGSVTTMTIAFGGPNMCGINIPYNGAFTGSTIRPLFHIPISKVKGRVVKLRVLFADNVNSAGAYTGNVEWKASLNVIVGSQMISATATAPTSVGTNSFVLEDTAHVFTPSTNAFWKKWVETPAFIVTPYDDLQLATISCRRTNTANDTYPRDILMIAMELIEVPLQG